MLKGAFLVANYNKQERIAICLRSLLNQIVTDENKEKIERMDVLITDDCSDDSSAEIIMWFANRYPDIIKFKAFSDNMGIGHTRNCLLRQAQAAGYDFVVTMDSDDVAGDFCVNNILDMWDDTWDVSYENYIVVNHINVPIGEGFGCVEAPAFEDVNIDKIEERLNIAHGGLCVKGNFLKIEYPNDFTGHHRKYMKRLVEAGAKFRNTKVRRCDKTNLILNPGFYYVKTKECMSTKHADYIRQLEMSGL